MPSEDKAKLSLTAVIDEAWRFDTGSRPWRSLTSIPEMPAHSHWFKHDHESPLPRGIIQFETPDRNTHNHHVAYPRPLEDGVKFDTGLLFKHMHAATPAVFEHDGDVVSWLKAEMTTMLNAEVKKEMESFLFGDGSPIIDNKENNMSDRSLRTPEGPIETKDLTVALRALGNSYSDEILDAVALVQALESNQRLVRADKLKQQDLGSHLQLIDSVGGVLTDLRDFSNFGRQDNGMVKAVVGGKMIELRPSDFVVLTALAN